MCPACETQLWILSFMKRMNHFQKFAIFGISILVPISFVFFRGYQNASVEEEKLLAPIELTADVKPQEGEWYRAVGKPETADFPTHEAPDIVDVPFLAMAAFSHKTKKVKVLSAKSLGFSGESRFKAKLSHNSYLYIEMGNKKLPEEKRWDYVSLNPDTNYFVYGFWQEGFLADGEQRRLMVIPEEKHADFIEETRQALSERQYLFIGISALAFFAALILLGIYLYFIRKQSDPGL